MTDEQRKEIRKAYFYGYTVEQIAETDEDQKETLNDNKHLSSGDLRRESNKIESDYLYPYPPAEDLVKERNELRTKYAAINRYINCIADPDKVTYSEMKILEKQREIIGDYVSILDVRLERSGIKDD